MLNGTISYVVRLNMIVTKRSVLKIPLEETKVWKVKNSRKHHKAFGSGEVLFIFIGWFSIRGCYVTNLNCRKYSQFSDAFLLHFYGLAQKMWRNAIQGYLSETVWHILMKVN